ncbi:hypothetical protein SDJN03_13751, partial [Cucurbita argyrosperma subsp. sororia]
MAMEMSATASGKRLCFVVGVLLMVASAHFLTVEGRTLRSVSEKLADGKEKMGGVEAIGVAAFRDQVNSLSSSSHSEFRSLSFVLASGPSKKGPGH